MVCFPYYEPISLWILMAVGLGKSMGPTYQIEAPMSLRVPVQNPTDITIQKRHQPQLA